MPLDTPDAPASDLDSRPGRVTTPPAATRPPTRRRRSAGVAERSLEPSRRVRPEQLPESRLDRRVLSSILRHLAPAPIDLRLWDGTGLKAPDAYPVATIVIQDRATLWKLAYHPDLEFGEAFTAGSLTVDGDLVATLEAMYLAMDARVTPSRRVRGIPRAPVNSERRARHNVHHHYDLGNDFYGLWLDDQMVYTCAYFVSPDRSLERAQVDKMDHVCRKLRLRPGERVVEAGCGWGALALHMARHHGVTVKAYNVSTEQIHYARARAQQEGLADRVEFLAQDYRAIRGRFDAFVSVGMLEHVGHQAYATLGQVVDRVLDPTHGRALLHFIGRNWPRPLNAWITRRIFPGAYPPTLGEVLEHILQPWDLTVIDVENLRLHYAATLARWRERYERAAPQVEMMFDRPFVRAWRLYLAGSEAAFRAGSMQLFQLLLARPTDDQAPLTRAHRYGDERPRVM